MCLLEDVAEWPTSSAEVVDASKCIADLYN